MTGVLGGREQRRMRQRDDALLERRPTRGDTELYIHGVGMTDGNVVLQPVEMDLPGAAEWVGSGLKFAEVIKHLG